MKGVLGRESSHTLCGTQHSAWHILRALKKCLVVVALALCDRRQVMQSFSVSLPSCAGDG